MERVGDLPIASTVQPGEIRARLPDAAPEEPEPFAALLRDLDEIVLPGITHWQAPGWFAYFPANASPPSILAELVAAGLGAQGMLWATSPAPDGDRGARARLARRPPRAAAALQDRRSGPAAASSR